MAAPTDSIAPSLTTSHNHAHAGYSSSNLPELLFRLEPPIGYGTAVFNNLRDPNGRSPRKPNGQPYQNFPWLPNQISIQPEAFLLEYWNRKHPDCSYADFEIRMRPGLNEGIPARNTLNMRRIRDVRLPLNVPSWTQKSDNVTLTDCLIFESLSFNSVRRNTILPVKPWGFVKPILPGPLSQSASHQNLINATAPLAPPAPLPLRTFTDGKEAHVPTVKLNAVKNLIAHLQDTAFEKLLPHWIFLQNQEKPRWWNEHRDKDPHDTISIPLLSAMPHLARDWIKECVREAAEPQSRLVVPPVSVLPKSSRGWVTECMRDGRARSAVATGSMIVEQSRRTWSLEVEAPEDSYISELSQSLLFTEDEAQGEPEETASFSGTSDLSSVSEGMSCQSCSPELNERTQATWTEHWRNYSRVKAIAKALRTGRPGSAVVLADHSARITTSDRRLMVFKNVLVVPETIGRGQRYGPDEVQEPGSKRRRTLIEERAAKQKSKATVYDLVEPENLYEKEDGLEEELPRRVQREPEETDEMILKTTPPTYQASANLKDDDDLYGISDREDRPTPAQRIRTDEDL